MLYDVSSHISRKLKHVEACLNFEVDYQTRSAGFEHYDLPYKALPQTDLGKIDTHSSFLGKALSFPFLIGAMTGGAELSGTINKHLAEAAEATGVGLMLGSQRVMLANKKARASFEVRAFAPTILLIGNLGVAQLNKGYGETHIVEAIESIGADALALHTNPLQEALQPGGDGDFTELVEKLNVLVPKVPHPLLLKEVGHGLSAEVALSVKDAGFAALDVAGAGGTSWAKVEDIVRYGELRHADLCEWGIPTTRALTNIHAALPKMPLIASGGVRSGLDIAKALGLGAGAVAIAKPLLKPAIESTQAVINLIERYRYELKIAMHCSGAKDIAALQKLNLKIEAGN